MSDYETRMKEGMIAFGRAMDANIFCGPQPTEQKLFEGGECPSCHGYGGSYGPEQGFPNGWTCCLCGGNKTIRAQMLDSYLPYPDGHPNKGTPFERTGWKT